MRQQAYTKVMVCRKLRQSTRGLRVSLSFGTASLLPIFLASQRRRIREDHVKIMCRTVAISSTLFNINAYSDFWCLHTFRLRLQEIPEIPRTIEWNAGRTSRSGYLCVAITATCIVLRLLAYPCGWVDLELTFGMHSSALSEIFREAIEGLYEKRSPLLTTFRSDLLQDRAAPYAEVMEARGATLDNFIGFIDGTNEHICRPGLSHFYQNALYSGHKRCHCLLYQTIATPSGLVFHLYGPVKGIRNDMTL